MSAALKLDLTPTKVELTPDQERGLRELVTWWNLPENHPYYYNCILSAPAGAGKTFLTKYFTSQLQKAYPLFTATTNEAARQLELAGVNVYGTTHSALGLIPSMSQEETLFIQGRLPEVLGEINLLVVDEASMAGIAAADSPFLLVGDYVINLGVRTLWLGDWYQLPPVESKNGISPIFEQDFYTVQLTEVVRNKGAILEFCTSLRDSIDSPVKRMPRVPKGVESITTPNFYKRMKDEQFLESARKGTTRIIGWRNSTTNSINARIREGIFGKELATANPYLPTDQILFIKPLVSGQFPESPDNLVGCKTLKQAASINSKAEILSVVVASMYNISCYKCKMRIEGGVEEIAWIPTKEGDAQLNRIKTALIKQIASLKPAQKCSRWEQWHAFYNCFAMVKHSYAITTHRSQGSTIPNVVVDTIDILSAAGREPMLAYKMLYTASSRARDSLTLIRR